MSDMLTSEAIQPTAKSEPALRLHDHARSDQLDCLFASYFGRARRPSLRVTANHILKRLLDIAASSVLLLLMLPVMLVSGIATLLDTGSPILYSQTRRTRFGRRMRVHKMRTLVRGVDKKLDALVSIKHDGKFLNVKKANKSYTRVGRWLERLWIVEFPQIWSVLTGDMSLVGNRPIPDYVIYSVGTTPDVLERFASPQGMTGYVQIIGRDDVTDDQRIALEKEYSRIFEHGDVFLEDLRIIGMTLMTYLGLSNKRSFEDFAPQIDAALANEAEQHRLQQRGPIVGAEVQLESHLPRLDQLACPTCYSIGDGCSHETCAQHCIKVCPEDAITIGTNGKPTIGINCTACSLCVTACPEQVIDKVQLTVNGRVSCPQCGTKYPQKNGVIDLLPQKPSIRQSPYFEFYEHDYVGDNPELHVEDTDWKLRELRPLFERLGSTTRLLDLGCGAAVLGRRIAAELGVSDRVSADWSTQILSHARTREADGGMHATGAYVRADAAYLPFRNRSFDLAMLIDVIEHQEKPEQVLREISRTSGHLLMRTPLEDCWYEELRRKHRDLFRESSGHVVHYNLDSVRRQFSDNGFQRNSDSVKRIAWSHWKRVIFEDTPLKGRFTAMARAAAGMVLPVGLYRRLFVTNYNGLFESRYVSADTEQSKPSRHRESA
jgi:lipopolysaccharide/colanic/teichoic acid biosynthesis glycosyltransferase/SAM-dependent methyltransferase/ferredoxin